MDRTIVNEMLHCYVDTARCKYFNESSTVDLPPNTVSPAPSTPYPQYVGVTRSRTFHVIATQRLLTSLTGEDVLSENMTQADCKRKGKENQNVWNFYYLKTNETCQLCNLKNESCDNTTVTCGVCKRTLSFFNATISPAYLIQVLLINYAYY